MLSVVYSATKTEDDKTKEESSSSDSSDPTYPAMSREEIESWMEHIPVFAVTDSAGAGVVLKPENDTSVFYFFLNPLQANATLSQLKLANAEMDLRVSAFSLGKIWFNLLHGDADREVTLKVPVANKDGDATDAATEFTTAKGVEYRLVPDTRDLLGARMLLTMSPEDGEKLKDGGKMTTEMAQAAVQRALTEAPKFNTTYNEIPIFTIAQMRMQKVSSKKEGEEASSEEEPVALLPMYFSLQNMVGTWQEFMKQAPADVQNVEPAINLMSLSEIVEMMAKESPIDWRNVVLVPTAMSSPGSGNGGSGSSPSADAATEAMASMSGATLGDI
jgi:Tic22-like family